MYNKSELALFYEKAGRGVCSHAYIVDGAAGIGKLEFALSCARALLCTGKTKPCGICQSCRKFSLGGHPDIHITGTGEKCAGVDDIRELIRLASVMPNDGDMQVFIIANAGKMRAGAQNALLKLFEEPPPTVTVFLLTETRNSLLPTLLSRGQRIHLDGMSPKEALAELAARCGGSGGEAERALEAANRSVGEAERLLSPESAENRKKACEILLYALSGKSYELSKALLLPKYKREKLYDILDSLLLLLLQRQKEKYGFGAQPFPPAGELAALLASAGKRSLARAGAAVISCMTALEASANVNAAASRLAVELIVAASK